MWLRTFTGNSHASNWPSCWPMKAPHSPATVKGFSGSAWRRRCRAFCAGVKFWTGASQLCACAVAHIAIRNPKVCPTLEAVRRKHLSPLRAMSRMLVFRSCLTQLTLLIAVLLQFLTVHAQSRTPEQQAAANMEQARAAGPLALHAFLAGMPKGGDLHNHLGGAVYAETWLRDAAADHICIDPKALDFVHRGPALATAPCVAPLVDASTLTQNQPLYDLLIDAFSMRSFEPVTGDSAHDHFFATFGLFSGLAESH